MGITYEKNSSCFFLFANLPFNWKLLVGYRPYALTLAAIRVLPRELPVFFSAGKKAIAHCALDPDNFRNGLLPQAKAAEGPEHYIDLEYLKGQPLPRDRYAFIALCQKIRLAPEKVYLLYI
jgi:hypothetical protein